MVSILEKLGHFRQFLIDFASAYSVYMDQQQVLLQFSSVLLLL